MKRRLVPVLVALLVLAGFAWTLVFLYQKSRGRPAVHQTALPEVRDVVKKTVAPGAIQPRKEVAIKSRVSGIVEKLYLDPGQRVERGTLLARIQIIPDMVKLNQAEAAFQAAQLNLEDARLDLGRKAQMHDAGSIPEAEYSKQKVAMSLRQRELEAAESNLSLVREGASRKSGQISNLVYSTMKGMLLDVPVKEGASVIEANPFNDGTTIATVADMNDILFVGRVDESEVGQVKEGTPVSIAVAALGEQRFEGTIEFISPKGKDREGTIEFEVRAAVKLRPGTFLRANYSANADIVLQRRDQVLSIEEGWVEYQKEKAFVEVEVAPQRFERRAVELGLSDGIWVEVKSGLGRGDRVKKPDATPAGAGR